ncbi:MAG: hypothetical protein K6G65_10975 [Lachnospiraceae bacterium]|nr:hypothetical protein [Lachnospiraceae bacterium]
MFEVTKRVWSKEYARAQQKENEEHSTFMTAMNPVVTAIKSVEVAKNVRKKDLSLEEAVLARKITMYLLRVKYDLSLETIRLITGCYDSEEVMSGINYISTKMSLSTEFRDRIRSIATNDERR